MGGERGERKIGKSETFFRSFEKLNRKKYFFKILHEVRENLSDFPIFTI